MIGIVVVTHGSLSETLIKTAEMIVGAQQNLIAVCFHSSEGLDDLKDKVKKAIDATHSNEGVIVFTDMFGGSTSIISSYFISKTVEVITGVNLPMLLETILSRENVDNIKDLVKLVIEKSKKSIIAISEIHKISK
ncbi:MAG: PTS sugar transporter subunit IIA [Candidatus Firestonebacteria bacterium]